MGCRLNLSLKTTAMSVESHENHPVDEQQLINVNILQRQSDRLQAHGRPGFYPTPFHEQFWLVDYSDDLKKVAFTVISSSGSNHLSNVVMLRSFFAASLLLHRYSLGPSPRQMNVHQTVESIRNQA